MNDKLFKHKIQKIEYDLIQLDDPSLPLKEITKITAKIISDVLSCLVLLKEN